MGKHDEEETLANIALAKAQTELTLLEQEKVRAETEKIHWRIASDKRFEEKSSADADQHCVYTMYTDVNSNSVRDAIKDMSMWSRRDPGKDITIVLNSPGGSVFDGLALYDFIRDLSARGHKMTIHAMGMAASMGGVLLQAGDVRTMSPNSFMLIHEVSSLGIGSLTDIEDEVKFLRELQKRCVNILTSKSALTPQKIHSNWKRKDWWLPAEECLELGLVDEIR